MLHVRNRFEPHPDSRDICANCKYPARDHSSYGWCPTWAAMNERLDTAQVLAIGVILGVALAAAILWIMTL